MTQLLYERTLFGFRKEDIVKCKNCLSVSYCNKECLESAQKSHSLVCLGSQNLSVSKSMKKLVDFCTKNNNPIPLLLCQFLAQLASRSDNKSVDSQHIEEKIPTSK